MNLNLSFVHLLLYSKDPSEPYVFDPKYTYAERNSNTRNYIYAYNDLGRKGVPNKGDNISLSEVFIIQTGKGDDEGYVVKWTPENRLKLLIETLDNEI